MLTRRHTADTPLCLCSAYAAQRISAKQSRQARAQAFPHMSWGVPMCLCACFAEICSAAIDLPRQSFLGCLPDHTVIINRRP